MSDTTRTWSCPSCGRRVPNHLATCPHCDGGSDVARFDDLGAPPDRVAGPSSRRSSALDTLRTVLVGGFLVGVVGVVIAVLAWPGTEETYDYAASAYDTEDTGNLVLALGGLVICSVGNMMMLVGIIGYGVMLGTRAAAHPYR